MFTYHRMGLIRDGFIAPRIHFPYELFPFLAPLPEPMMNAMLVIMMLCSVLITLGLLFRPACWVLGLFHFYFLMLDKSIFNNHIYLFVLLAFLLSVTHADHFLSLKRKAKDVKIFRVQRWEVFILQLQFAIVYFYGGLVKLSPDWIFRMQPMKGMVAQFPDSHWMAPVLKNDFMVPFLTYGGLVFDLAIPFLLWNKRSRKWALIPLILFHLPNSQIFNDIGVFPFAMILATLLFFNTEEIPLLKGLLKKERLLKITAPVLLEWPIWVRRVVVSYVIFQLLFPFRGLFLPNPMDWTSVANRFAWRMKVHSKDIEQFQFFIQEGKDGEKQPIPANQLINPMQFMAVAHDARAAAQMARQIAVMGRQRGMKDPVVKANIKVIWNGRPPAYTVNPDVDLSKVSYSPFKRMEWVMPVPD